MLIRNEHAKPRDPVDHPFVIRVEQMRAVAVYPDTVVIDRVIRVPADMIPLIDDIDAEPPVCRIQASAKSIKSTLHLDDDVLFLDRHRDRLRHIRALHHTLAFHHLHRIFPYGNL